MVSEENLNIILVNPQLGWNIGSIARAMLNFHIKNLRIINPRDGWPNVDAIATAAGAKEVLDKVKVFSSTVEAISDLNRVFAASGRPHDMVKSICSPHVGIEGLYKSVLQGEKVGILFGGERNGLLNEDIALCESIITIPSNPKFPSLNIAHAVVLLAYEWKKCMDQLKEHKVKEKNPQLAEKKDLIKLFEHLELELDYTGFLRHEKKRPTMVRNIRNMFQRAQLTTQEVRTFRGIIRSLREGERN